MSLQYRRDWKEARDRLTAWWQGEDIGRPAMQLQVPRTEPAEEIPQLPEPEGWVTRYSTRDLDYRVNLARRTCLDHYYMAEAVPRYASGDVGPNSLALFLGCTAREAPGTVWFEPCIDEPGSASFEYDPDNFYWKFCLDVYQRTMEKSEGKFLQEFPDLIEGLDTLGAMRGFDQLLFDLIDRRDWVKHCLREITDRYFHYYDILYDMFRDEVGGSVFWAWAPGRMAKFQCDVSAMLSPEMFEELMYPVLCEMAERVAHSMYHLDGPDAVKHLDTLLAVPELDMIQWTPGAGQEATWHNRWWPLYHRIIDGGKKVLLGAGDEEHLRALKEEFGEKCLQMMIRANPESRKQAEDWMQLMRL